MDNLTHSLFGLTLARTPLGRSGRGTTVAFLLASNAPDIDIVATAGGAASYLEWHRGPTHGLLGMVGLGLVVAAIAWTSHHWWDRKTTAPAAPLGRLWIVSMIAIVCHVLMDLPTSYGTRPLSPFAWTWFAEDWMPIVDIYLLAILGAGLWFGRTRANAEASLAQDVRGRNASVALMLMMANYGVRAVAHHEAIAEAPQIFGAQLPTPCSNAVPPGSLIDRWPRGNTRAPGDRGEGRCLMEIAALPDALSPFRWRLIAQLSTAYEVRTVNVVGGSRARSSDSRLLSVHYPNEWTPAVMKAAESPIARVFLGFSRFPAARSVVAADGSATVRWIDLRFVVQTGPNERQRPLGLFSATIQMNPEGHIVSERLGP